jgi:hypothetical protein
MGAMKRSSACLCSGGNDCRTISIQNEFLDAIILSGEESKKERSKYAGSLPLSAHRQVHPEWEAWRIPIKMTAGEMDA